MAAAGQEGHFRLQVGAAWMRRIFDGAEGFVSKEKLCKALEMRSHPAMSAIGTVRTASY